MNRAERRRLAKQGKKIAKDPVYTVKASDTREAILKNPIVKQIVDQEVTQILLEKDKQYAIDVDAMVMWALHAVFGVWPQTAAQVLPCYVPGTLPYAKAL